jgi:hypothetical protein
MCRLKRLPASGPPAGQQKAIRAVGEKHHLAETRPRAERSVEYLLVLSPVQMDGTVIGRLEFSCFDQLTCGGRVLRWTPYGLHDR